MKLSELRKTIAEKPAVTQAPLTPTRVGGFTCQSEPRFASIVEDEETGLVSHHSMDEDFAARWLRPCLGTSEKSERVVD